VSYDPEIWLESLIREIKAYVTGSINTRIYDVVMEFPGAMIDAEKMPIQKTLIHFAVDAIDSREVGLGDNVFATNYNDTTGEIQPQAAMVNLVNFDVGVWSSDKSGGTTARMRARQILQNLFGINAVDSFRTRTDGGDGGIEILRISGGRFTTETVTDIRLYRMIDCQMDVRVYSRTPLASTETQPAIEEILQAPDLTIIG
jgi:hypothetical protein